MADSSSNGSSSRKKLTKTEDDAAIASTDSKRSMFSKGRSSSSKNIGSRKLSSTPTTAEDKERLKKMLLEGSDKAKPRTKSKAEKQDPESSTSESTTKTSDRPKIQPLDEETSEYVKKKSKRRDSDSVEEPKSSKSKSSKNTEIQTSAESPVEPLPRRDSKIKTNNEGGDSPIKKSKRKSGGSVPPLPSVASTPPSLTTVPDSLTIEPQEASSSDSVATEVPKASPTKPTVGVESESPRPPMVDNLNRTPRSIPSPSPRATIFAPSPRPHETPGMVALPPPIDAEPEPIDEAPASTPEPTVVPVAVAEDPVPTSDSPVPTPDSPVPTSDSPAPVAASDEMPAIQPDPTEPTQESSSTQSSAIHLPKLKHDNSSGALVSGESDEESSSANDEAKKKKTKKPEEKSHTRERSSTKSRRDSVSLDVVTPLALSGVPTSSAAMRSPGSMRLNRTPRADAPHSPGSTQIIIVTPRGEIYVEPETHNHLNLTISAPAGNPAATTPRGIATRKESVDSDDGAQVAAPTRIGSFSASTGDLPNIGLPPPPPPLPNRGAIAVNAAKSKQQDEEASQETVVAKKRPRVVNAAVDTMLNIWDRRPLDFETRLAALKAKTNTPEEILEFPSDDLLIEVSPSALAHFPTVDKSTTQSVQDIYSSFTAVTKTIVHQSEWYGTRTSQKERLKEYEIRQARAKAEAEKAAANTVNVEIRNSASPTKNARRPSVSRQNSSDAPSSQSPSQAERLVGGRRGSRAIKMTTADLEAMSTVQEDDHDDSAAESENVDLSESTGAGDRASAGVEDAALPTVDVSGTPPSNEKKAKPPGSGKRHKLQSEASGSSLSLKPDGSPGPGRPASPDPLSKRGSAGRSSTLRPSSSKKEDASGTPPVPTAKTNPRVLNRGISSLINTSVLDQSISKEVAGFALRENLMEVDDKIRRKEAEKADKDRKGIFEVFTPLSITAEASDHVQPVEQLRPKVDTRILIHIKNMKLNLGYEEAFFISGAFYDVEKRIRLTENFYVDFNDQNELLKALLSQHYGKPEPESTAKRFIANLTYHSPSIYLVFRVNTILHGDVDDVADPYSSSAGTASSKDRQKIVDAARQATSLLGKFQQGFGWAAIPVFDERSNFRLTDDHQIQLMKMKTPLADTALFDALTAEEKTRTKPMDASISFGGWLCTRDKFQLLNMVDSTLVHWPAEVPPSLENKMDKAGAILKSLVKPPTPVSDIVKELDVFEQTFDKPSPYWSPIHHLFVYPTSFNLALSKLKVKSVSARVYLMKSDEGIEKSALPAIFSRSSDTNFISTCSTTVWWESASNPLWDEIKIKLPYKLEESHHLLFVFYHVHVKVLNKKKEGTGIEPSETPFGYAWMPLIKEGIFAKDVDHTLPIISIPNPNGHIADYRSKEGELIDKEKATFSFKTRLQSTLNSQDENLASYFHMYDKNAAAEKASGKDKKKMFDHLTKADPKAIMKFFPVLLNQLVYQLCNTKNAALQLVIFKAIVTISLRVFDLTMVSGKLTVSEPLYAYAVLFFDLPSHGSLNPADVLASNWVRLLEVATPKEVLTNAGYIPLSEDKDKEKEKEKEKISEKEQHELQALANFSLKDVSWFLFELIYKSLVLNMSKNGASRKQITSPTLQQAITRLVQFVDLHRRGVGSGFDHINRVLARTFNRLFSMMDRGLVLDLIHSHLSKLEGDQSATMFRFRFLQIVCDYEHYIPLNLLSYTPIESPGTMALAFWKNHYLSGLYLNELRAAFLGGEEAKITRSKAIARFRDLLWKHHLDDRYQGVDHRARIAGMYMPLLVLLVEKVTLLVDPAKATRMDENERYEWSLVGLWIYRYLNKELQIRPWWKLESTENLVNLFTLLKFILDTFTNDEAMKEEIIYVLAETYDFFIDDLYDELSTDGSKVMEALSLSMLNTLRLPKSERATLRLMQIVRTYVIKFKRPLFRFLSNYTICGDLTYEILSLCQSQPKRVMMYATSILYLMLRTNNDEMGHFARMKLQSTSAMSKLVKREGCNYDELMNCLEAMSLYEDKSRPTSWDNQIREFINRHARIIRDNIRAVSLPQSFSDKKAEIYYQISLEYVYSPDLRIAWLGNLAAHHETQGSLIEAACCKVQIASLVAEYMTQVLSLKQPIKGVPEEASIFARAFPGIKDEKSFSTIWLEGNTILSPQFSEDGLVKALHEACDLFIAAEDLESSIEVQMILANYFKENRRWEMLATLSSHLAPISQRLYEANRAQSRVTPNFYRVGFYGKGFDDDDGKEYIYRVNPSQRLADFTTAMKDRYSEKFGEAHLELLGNKPLEEYAHVDQSKKNYLQIVACDIYYDYDEWSTKDRLTYADRSFDIRRFCFETPYSPGGGKPSEEVSKTWKRKIILYPAKPFPYVLTRVPIRKKQVRLLPPIESAIDLLLTIVQRFKEALNCVPPNTKTVQIILQGSILTTVNAGPLAIIREFLGNAANYPPDDVKKVGDQVKAFVRLAKFGLSLNANLIKTEKSLEPLHNEMIAAYKTLSAEADKYELK